jgi:hypothetical protein
MTVEREGTGTAGWSVTGWSVFHVIPLSPDGWGITWEGSQAVAIRYATQAEAIETAQHLAKRRRPARVLVHSRDSQIQAGYVYREGFPRIAP